MRMKLIKHRSLIFCRKIRSISRIMRWWAKPARIVTRVKMLTHQKELIITLQKPRTKDKKSTGASKHQARRSFISIKWVIKCQHRLSTVLLQQWFRRTRPRVQKTVARHQDLQARKITQAFRISCRQSIRTPLQIVTMWANSLRRCMLQQQSHLTTQSRKHSKMCRTCRLAARKTR